MPTETKKPLRQSQSRLWLVAGVPVLLIIAFLIFQATQAPGADGTDGQAQTQPESNLPADSTDGGK